MQAQRVHAGVEISPEGDDRAPRHATAAGSGLRATTPCPTRRSLQVWINRLYIRALPEGMVVNLDVSSRPPFSEAERKRRWEAVHYAHGTSGLRA